AVKIYLEWDPTAIMLTLFLYSLEGAAKIWYEKEPPRSILTWGDLVSKFMNHFFPPSKTIHLKNEITRFTQKFMETFGEPWERFKEMLRQCPHHEFLELHQINTFYNGLNEHEQDSLNDTMGRNLLRKTPQDALIIIENKSKVCYSRNMPVTFKVSTTSSGNSSSTDARIDKLMDTISNLVETFNKKMTTPATVKEVEETCVICEASSSGLDSLPSNTVPNPRADLKAITTRSGVTLAGPSVSLPPFKEVDREPETLTDQVLTGSTNNVPPLVVQPSPVSISFSTISSSKMPEVTKDTFVNYVVDPRVPLILGRPFLRTERALIDVYGEELTLRVNDEAITFNVRQTSKYSYNDVESINRIDVIDVACEEYVQEVLGFSDKSKSGSPTPTSDPIISSSSPSFTPFKGSDFILEEIKTFLQTSDELSNLDDDYYDTEGDILYLEKLLIEDPFPNFPSMKTEDLKQVDATIMKPSIEEPPELELKELPSHLEYAFLEEPISTFQRYMIAIFHDMIEKTMEVFMDDFPVFGDSSLRASLIWTKCYKGAENLAADHLSRLENPHQDELENKEIIETFPLETLCMIAFRGDSSTPWTIGENRASWFDKLDDTLWAFRTAFKTPIGCTPYKFVYGKACHLPIELEHKAYYALKHCNFDLKTAGDHQKVLLNELNELCDQAYENSLIYRDKTKKIHNSKIKNRVFNVGNRVLLFNSPLTIFSGKLKTHWTGPFTVAHVFLYGTIELSQADGPNFKVNGHRLKHYFRRDIPKLVVPDL
nr:reverse transcriptase domain-containing protein [Tanacetum cinerariifolium]